MEYVSHIHKSWSLGPQTKQTASRQKHSPVFIVPKFHHSGVVWYCVLLVLSGQKQTQVCLKTAEMNMTFSTTLSTANGKTRMKLVLGVSTLKFHRREQSSLDLPALNLGICEHIIFTCSDQTVFGTPCWDQTVSFSLSRDKSTRV